MRGNDVEWLRPNETVCIDTSPLIYFIQENERYLPVVEPVFRMAEDGYIQIVTSVITLLEVLVWPLEQNRQDLAEQYAQILSSNPAIRLVPVDATVAALAAELRAMHRLRVPDAVQLATALHQQADVFLTNDRDFLRVDPPLDVVLVSNPLRNVGPG